MLAQTREKVEHPIFLHEDTHWNELSGYVASRELIRMAGGKTPLPAIDQAKLVPAPKPLKGGDLRTQLGNGKPGVYHYYEVEVPGIKKVPVKVYRPAHPMDNHHRRSRKPNAPDSRKVWVYRDSFAQAMEPYISMYFREVDYYWNVPIRRIQFNGTEKPDLVIFQVVERNIVSLDNVDFESKRKANLQYFVK